MTIQEAIQQRHAVRSYTDQPIPETVIQTLREEISRCNQAGNLHIQLVVNEPKAFDSMMAHYGKFSNVRNYIALIGPAGKDLEEKTGYYGERLALLAQTLGLNNCWVAMSFAKGTVRKVCQMAPGEKLTCVISLGYGTTQGIAHRSKPASDVYQAQGDIPAWFQAGVASALLAPTAVNQQNFLFVLQPDGSVTVKNKGGFYSAVDLGIVKYHFEIGSGKKLS